MTVGTFYTVAYPEIPATQMQWIEEIRRQHDPQYAVVRPHFTLVFRVCDVQESMYFRHVESVARLSKPIVSRCLYAMLDAGDVDSRAYVYLVPDEGNAEISLLHDRLYSGVLQPHQRLEIPYIPHITVGTTQDLKLAKQLCDGLNRAGVCVQGTLGSISVGVLENAKFHTVRSFRLGSDLSPTPT